MILTIKDKVDDGIIIEYISNALGSHFGSTCTNLIESVVSANDKLLVTVTHKQFLKEVYGAFKSAHKLFEIKITLPFFSAEEINELILAHLQENYGDLSFVFEPLNHKQDGVVFTLSYIMTDEIKAEIEEKYPQYLI